MTVKEIYADKIAGTYEFKLSKKETGGIEGVIIAVNYMRMDKNKYSLIYFGGLSDFDCSKELQSQTFECNYNKLKTIIKEEVADILKDNSSRNKLFTIISEDLKSRNSKIKRLDACDTVEYTFEIEGYSNRVVIIKKGLTYNFFIEDKINSVTILRFIRSEKVDIILNIKELQDRVIALVQEEQEKKEKE